MLEHFPQRGRGDHFYVEPPSSPRAPAGSSPSLSEPALESLRLRYEEEPSGLVEPGTYPHPREREEFVSVWPGERFWRYETTRGYVSLGTVAADLIHFSGFPDVVEIFVLDNGAILTFDCGLPQARDEITIGAGNFYEPKIRTHKVRARNATAGLVARVQVVGKWVPILSNSR